MRVNTIVADPNEGFRALVYGAPNEHMLSYIEKSVNSAASRIGDIGKGFIDRTREVYNSINGADVINRARGILNMAGSSMSADAIYYLNQDNLGKANTIMQRYIMSQPEHRSLFNKQQCNGYDNYVDLYKDFTNDETPEYMEVMDGLASYTPYGDIDPVFYNHSHEIDPLRPYDQMTIFETWHNVRSSILDGLDPVSGEEL